MNEQENSTSLNQKRAEQLIRMFNVGFNSALLYGGDHQTTYKNIEPFFSLVTQELENIPVISFIIERESLFVDDFTTDKAINSKRIVGQFLKCGIQSVSFSQGLSLGCLQAFFKLACNVNEAHSAQEIETFFISSGCKGIRLNHVRFGKITSDETLVTRDEANRISSATGDSQIPQQISKNAIDEIHKVISLARLLDQPSETAKTIAQSFSSESGAIAATEAIEKVRSEVQSSSPQSVEALLNAVLELKVDLSEVIKTQKLAGRILSATDPAQKEIDKLTCDVIVKLINEEYITGDISVKRLAQIIRRMLPDLSELKRVLPMLKTVLLNNGMSLSEYLLLIRQIDIEVESESVTALLSDAASGIGASAEDVFGAIKSHPDEAAKLIFLASEIRNGTDQNEEQLSGFLAEYIEKISSGTALDAGKSGHLHGDNSIDKIISDVESQLLDKLKKYGLEQPVLLKVRQLLDERYSHTCTGTIAEWMAENIKIDSDSDMQNLTQKLSSFIDQESALQKLSQPLFNAFLDKGYSAEQIDQFIKKLSIQIKTGKKSNIPSDILSSNNMLFMLNREIKQYIRYNTPFSTMLISVASIYTDPSSVRKPLSDELSQITPQLFSFVKSHLRDIDLTGSLNNKDAVILVLLSMTDNNGAVVVLNRINKLITETSFNVNNSLIRIVPIISITLPDREITKNLNSFLDIAKDNHKNELLRLSDNKDSPL